MHNKLKYIETKFKASEETRKKLLADLEVRDDEIKVINQKIKAQKTKIQDNQIEIEMAQCEIAELKQANESIQTNLQRLVVENNAHMAENQKMKVELETYKFQKKFWESEKKKEMDTIKKEFAAKAIREDHVCMTQEDLSSSIMRCEEVILKLREQNIYVNHKLEELMTRYDIVKIENSTKDDQIEALKEKLY